MKRAVTRAHRLAVLEAWHQGDQILGHEYEWAEKGPEAYPQYPRYEALAQLLADREGDDLSRLFSFFQRLGVSLEQWGSASEQFLKIKLGGNNFVKNFTPKFVPEMWVTFIFREGKDPSIDYGVNK